MRILNAACLAILMIAMLALTGCTPADSNQSGQSMVSVIGNPTAQQIVENNPDADIFQFNNIVYSNASDLEWVQQADLTIGERVGAITKQYQADLMFEDGMATELPIGTEIYEPVKKYGDILIVVVNGQEIRYFGLLEG